MSEDHRESIFQTGLEGSQSQVQKPWSWLKIAQQVATAVEDNSWDRYVCWGKLGIALASGEQGAHNLTEIVGAPTSVEDIWLGIGSVGTDHGAGAVAAAATKDY